MEAFAARPVPRAREPLLVAALAAVSATLVATLAPPGGDSAAHLYRTELLRDGVALWDNYWYGGQYPLASYSLLYYLPAALVGNVVLVAAAVVVSAALFAAIAKQEWGAAARWPARLFGVLAAGPLFTGTYSYALGLAAALGTLRLFQTGHRALAIGAAAVALGFSPLAFAFLLVALVAVAVAHRPGARSALLVAAALVAIAAVQAATILLFPAEGRYPFSPLSLAAVLAVSGLGAALAFRSAQGRVLGAFFVTWALVGLLAFAIPSPFGDNLTRLRALVLPLVLIAAALARFRPRAVAVAAIAVALVYNLGPDVSALPKRVDDAPAATAAFWAPALAFLAERSTPDYRVEVVPTFGHWEAYRIPRGGFPLARGWYRQLDIVENPELYRDPLEPGEYRAWLRRMAVRYVLLPDVRLGPMGAEREAELLRSGRAGLSERGRLRGWTVYELEDPTPLLTGPGRARIDAFEHERVVAHVARPGTYRLRVRHTPYWHVSAGEVCVSRAADGTTMVRATHAGRFELTLSLLARGRSCPT
jgi:hypothetical protein